MGVYSIEPAFQRSLPSRILELAGKIRLDIGHEKSHDPREDAAASAVPLPRIGQRRCDNDPVLS
jgi:hypothetical protein